MVRIMGKIFLYKTHGLRKGTNLLIFGAVHGNEPAGPAAINSARARFDSGELTLLNGSITWVPIANPKAFTQDKRFVEEDLNRVFKGSAAPASYEAHLANELGMLIKSSDAFLDIHTTSAPGPTCVFIDFPTKENIVFANSLGMEYAITGWPSLYAANPFGQDSFDTTRYAYEQGKIGIIIECGQHREPTAIPIAEDSILRALGHFGMIDPKYAPAPFSNTTKTIHMSRLVYKDNDADALTKDWDHLEPIPKGTVIAMRADGEEIVAEEDSIMLLPKRGATARQEWFYIGEEK